MANPFADLLDVALLTLGMAWVGLTLLSAWLAPRPKRRAS